VSQDNGATRGRAADASAGDEGIDDVPERASEVEDFSSPRERSATDVPATDVPATAPPGEDASAEESAADLDLVAQALAERDEFKAIAQRIQADFENYRKRAQAQAAVDADRVAVRVVEELLPVLDACEAAFSHGTEGVEPIWSALIGALQRQGLEAMNLNDQPFDPSLADAVLHEPGEGDGEPIVSEVLRTGYLWKGKVLRAAMVKVKG
jgi:molecular chaperone GrpE